jgi:putative ABC transport system permease protein
MSAVSVRDLRERLEAIPGISSVAHMSGAGVLLGASFSQVVRRLPEEVREDGVRCPYNYVGPGFFQVMGISVRSGRGFLPGEEDNQNVAIITSNLAQRLFPGLDDPVGMELHNPDPRTIIGVVDDTKIGNLRESADCMIYMPIGRGSQFVATTDRDPEGLRDSIAGAIEGFDETLVVGDVRSFGQVVADTIVRERLVAELTTAFALAVVLLAAVGLYGTLSYSVAQRTREIGIRMALGARVPTVVGMILQTTGWVVGSGILAGIGLSLMTTQGLRTLLFGLSPADSRAFAVAVLVLIVTSLFAASFPARRAASVDPLQALRTD